jgi:hypothetical protein
MVTTLGNATASPVVYKTPLHCKVRITQHKENNHSEKASTEPDFLTKHGGLDNSSGVPPIDIIKARCPDSPIAQQPLLFKKHSLSPPTDEVCKSLHSHAPGRKAGLF